MPTLRISPSHSAYHAIVIGSGPNGLAAGITLARAGLRVLLVEALSTIGGGMRTEELTLPGFHHDICSAVHPMGAVSPFMRSVPLEKFGLEWVHPEILLAHPLDDGSAPVLHRDIAQTIAALPSKDRRAYETSIGWLARSLDKLLPDMLGPLLRFPSCPVAMTRFGLTAVQSGWRFAMRQFASPEARALFAGNAAHSILPLEAPATAAVGQMLMAAGHVAGWPVAKGGSQAIARALGRYFEALGGEIAVNFRVKSLADLPKAEAYLFDTTPRGLVEICDETLPARYRKRLATFRYGAGAFKVDLALSGPIPWKNNACRRAGTVHVGGTIEEIAEAERTVSQGKIPEKPFVLLAQQSVADSHRAPHGRHTCWAYCHVPSGSTGDALEPILRQIERFAPGFRDTILATRVMRPPDFEAYNPNYVGGDIIGGVQDLRQLLARPVLRRDPYATPVRSIYLCSSSTPPGGGVHGMCGHHAAISALRQVFGLSTKPETPPNIG